MTKRKGPTSDAQKHTKREIVTEGETTEQAIAAALRALQAAREDVAITVEQEAGRSLFGLVRRPARVRVTRRDAGPGTGAVASDSDLEAIVTESLASFDPDSVNPGSGDPDFAENGLPAADSPQAEAKRAEAERTAAERAEPEQAAEHEQKTSKPPTGDAASSQAGQPDLSVHPVTEPSDSGESRASASNIERTLTEEPVEDDPGAPPEDTPDSQSDGILSLKDGQIVLTPPSGGGQNPIIRVGKHVRVLVNGQEVQREQVVTAEDNISVEPLEDPATADVRVQIAPDQLTAHLVVELRAGMRYELLESPPAFKFTVTAVAAGAIAPPRPTIDELQKALAEAGVKFGIDENQLQALVDELADAHDHKTDPTPVAFGIAPEPPQDEQVELFFENEARVRIDPGDDEENVDLLGLYKIPTVQPGEILASKRPPVEGTPGRAVTGNEIPVRPPRLVELKPGDGAAFSDDQKSVVAARSGRPSFQGSTVTVHPEYTVNGNVDVETGHIEFEGDVTVKGDVTESMRVRANGKVQVSGSLYGAVLEADGDVVIGRGIVKADVSAGHRSAILVEVLAALRPLEDDLKALVKAVAEVKKHPALSARVAEGQGDGPLIKLTLERNFPNVKGYLQKLQSLLQGEAQGAGGEEFAHFLQQAHSSLTGHGPLQLKRIDEVTNLQVLARTMIEQFEMEQEETADVITRYVQNSEIRASGKIILTGGGSFNSHLWAGTGVEMESGMFRGYSITVQEGDVHLKEVGSPAGTPVKIELIKGGQFKSQRVHPNVEVVIKGQSYAFDRTARFVAVKLEDKGIKVIWGA